MDEYNLMDVTVIDAEGNEDVITINAEDYPYINENTVLLVVERDDEDEDTEDPVCIEDCNACARVSECRVI